MARPKQDKYKIDYMIAQIDEYIEHMNKEHLRPIVRECFLLNGWNEKYVYELASKEGNERLTDAINKIVVYKEIFLERSLDDPNIKPAGIIFSLKQLGWKDVSGLEIDKSSGVMDLVKSIQEIKNEDKS